MNIQLFATTISRPGLLGGWEHPVKKPYRLFPIFYTTDIVATSCLVMHAWLSPWLHLQLTRDKPDPAQIPWDDRFDEWADFTADAPPPSQSPTSRPPSMLVFPSLYDPIANEKGLPHAHRCTILECLFKYFNNIMHSPFQLSKFFLVNQKGLGMRLR